MNQTDHHFSKKLRDLEIAPSERANELFRSRMEQISPRKEKPGKYFATAAAVLLALGFLFALYMNENVMRADTAVVLPKSTEGTAEPKNGTGAATTEAPAAGIPATEATTTEASRTETGAPASGTPIAGTPAAKTPATQSRRPATNAPVIISETPARLASTSEPERLPSVKTLQNIKNLSDLQSLSPEISYRYHSTDLTDFAILDAHSQLELEIPLETRREAPGLSSRETSEKAAPLLTRVVREVKYIVNGEKPDLDRAGVKPTAIAFAHNPDGLLANESRQIREGIHKFKEIFR